MSQEHRSPYLTPDEAAEYLRVAARTLRNWRYMHKGPKSVRLGRKVVYRRADLDQYVDQNERVK